MAVFLLCLLLAYGFGRSLLHQRAVAVLESRIYQGEIPLRLAALPTPANPFHWVGLVEGRTFYDVHPELDLFRDFDPAAGRILYKLDPDARLETVRRTETFRVFQAFSQWPLWRITPVDEPENGSLVEAMDLRFGAPPEPRFVASAILDGSLRLERAWFQFGAPGRYALRRP